MKGRIAFSLIVLSPPLLACVLVYASSHIVQKRHSARRMRHSSMREGKRPRTRLSGSATLEFGGRQRKRTNAVIQQSISS